MEKITNPIDEQYFENGLDKKLAKIGHVNKIIDTLGYEEAIVDISSAQILNMGTTPIELLPAPGVNNYYDIAQIILETIPVTTPYTMDSFYLRIIGDGIIHAVLAELITSYSERKYIVINNIYQTSFVNSQDEITFDANVIGYFNNSPLTLNLRGNASAPTDGDDTLRAIIKYKIRTFGE